MEYILQVIGDVCRNIKTKDVHQAYQLFSEDSSIRSIEVRNNDYKTLFELKRHGVNNFQFPPKVEGKLPRIESEPIGDTELPVREREVVFKRADGSIWSIARDFEAAIYNWKALPLSGSVVIDDLDHGNGWGARVAIEILFGRKYKL